MIRTYLHLDVEQGQAADLVRLFKDLQILEASVEEADCLSAELTLSEDGRQAIVTATWDSIEKYADWTSRSDRASYAERLSQFLATPIRPESTGAQYTIAHSVLPGRADQPMKGES
ncbi:MAG: antibiotic biosynthesis monooxygenase [Acidimicrobiia bacterium]